MDAYDAIRDAESEARYTDDPRSEPTLQEVKDAGYWNAPAELVPRSQGGDDVAANLVPVCQDDHDALHRRIPVIGRLLLSRLSDAEYAYLVSKGGEDAPERIYGVEYGRES